MRTSMKWFMGAVVTGFAGTFLGCLALNHDGSRLVPMITFLVILSVVMLLVSLGTVMTELDR